MTQTFEPAGVDVRIADLSPERRRLLALLLRERQAPQPGQGRRLVAFVRAERGTDPAELRQFVREQLPHYLVPETIEVLPAIPRTPNGKVDHELLRRAALDRATRQPSGATAEAGGDEIERQLRALWSELLGVSQISVHDDFFALGGHSLLAVRMLARVKAELGRDVPVALIVESPTIARLASYLRGALATPEAPRRAIVPIQPEGRLTPLYLLPLHMHGTLHYRHLKGLFGTERPLYGFEGFDLRGAGSALPTIEALAGDYVDALLEFQPRGPYYLGGSSVAGLLAFEMARQLHARDVRDVTPILFDTWGPGYPERLPPLLAPSGLAAQLLALGAAGVGPLTQSVDLLIRALQKLKAAARATLETTRQARADQGASGAGPPGASQQQREVDLMLGAMTAAYLAAPRPYAGSIILFHASMQPWNARYDPTLGWTRFVRGEIRVVHTRGDHLGMFGRSWARPFTALLLRQLARLDRQSDLVLQEG